VSFDRMILLRVPSARHLDGRMWATPDETRDSITGLYQRAWKHTDATIAELPLDTPVTVPWWGDADVTLGRILVHMAAG
jgi:Protein of unknown function (DUF664)